MKGKGLLQFVATPYTDGSATTKTIDENLLENECSTVETMVQKRGLELEYMATPSDPTCKTVVREAR